MAHGKQSKQNPVAKYARSAGAQARVYRDRKRDSKRGRVKHTHQQFE